MSNVWGMICHAWNAVYYIQFSSQSSNPCKLHLALSHCHIGMKKSTHPGASAGNSGPPNLPVGWLEFTTQLDPRTNCASFAFRCWAIKGQAEETWWGPVAMPTLISMFKSPWNFVFTSATSVYSLEVPNGKISESRLLLNSQKNGTTADLCGLQMDFTAFHSISQNASLFEANPFGRCIPVATSLPHKRDASSCQEVVQSPRAQDRARNVGKAIINHPWLGMVYSLDWFKGKFTGNHGFYHQI